MGFSNPRGSGALSVDQQDEAIALIAGGLSQKQVATRYGVTKNVIASLWYRLGDPQPRPSDATTMFERLDALHARMNAVLAETIGVGRIKEPEQKPRPSFGNLF